MPVTEQVCRRFDGAVQGFWWVANGKDELLRVKYAYRKNVSYFTTARRYIKLDGFLRRLTIQATHLFSAYHYKKIRSLVRNFL